MRIIIKLWARIILLVFLLSLFSSLYAQQDFQAWLKKEQEKFQDFKDQRDKEFLDFLKKEWKEIELLQGIKPDDKPKPIDIPVVEPTKIPDDVIPERPKVVKDIEIPKPPPIEPPVVLEVPKPDVERGKVLDFTFFKSPAKIRYDEQFEEFELHDTITKEAIGGFGKRLAALIMNRCLSS